MSLPTMTEAGMEEDNGLWSVERSIAKERLMKKRMLFCLVIGGVLVSVHPCWARVGKAYWELARGNFTMPSEIQNTSSRTELLSYIAQKHGLLKMAAIRRLGEVEGDGAIPVLQDIVINDKDKTGVDYVPIAKLEAIRTLKKIDSPASRRALIDLFEGHWGRIQETEKNRDLYQYDYAPVMTNLINTLSRYAGSADVHQAFASAVSSQSIQNTGAIPDRIRIGVMRVHLQGNMLQSNLLAEDDQVVALVDDLNVVEGSWPYSFGSKTHIQRLAIRSLIEEKDIGELSSAEQKLDQIIQERSQLGAEQEKRARQLKVYRNYLKKTMSKKSRSQLQGNRSTIQ